MRFNEDDLYRQSTQYKSWSFTPAELARLRQKTNAHAAAQVKLHMAQDASERAKLGALDAASAPDSGADTPNPNGNGTGPGEVDCLTVDEEKRVVDKFCETAVKLGDFLKAQPDVMATAIQFMRRFYLYNSPMTYDGTKISKTAFFLAMKLELGTRAGSASDFAARLPRTTRDDIVAPEYTIVQALRFNFEVRHPFRGLKGLHLELSDMVHANYAYAPAHPDARDPADLRAEALAALDVSGEAEAEGKLGNIYAHAKDILTMAAQLTDAYFLYTPSQILLAAHLLAAPALTTFYLGTKIPTTSPTAPRIFATIQACADLLSSHRSFTKNPVQNKLAWAESDPPETKKAMKKLRGCKDPTTQDLVALNAGKKRDVVRDGTLEEGKAKRRKLNREQAEKESDSFWGPELKK